MRTLSRESFVAFLVSIAHSTLTVKALRPALTRYLTFLKYCMKYILICVFLNFISSAENYLTRF